MRVIAMRRLREFWEAGRAEAEGPLRAWYAVADRADWSGFADVRAVMPMTDQVNDKLIFNIGGNKYRLIVAVDYQRKGLLVRWLGTHAEYSKLRVEEL